MKLSNLLSPWVIQAGLDFEIKGIASDHRCIQEGFVFFACSGSKAHGCDYLQNAIEHGAIAVVVDEAVDLKPLTIPVVVLKNLKQNLSAIASRFYGEPLKKMKITGVTGTNGKTTVAYLLMQAQAILGRKSAYMGTLGVGDLLAMRHTGLTTPGAFELQAYAKDLFAQGTEYLAMEVSSHALDQGRVANIPFEQAIFTNLSHDHLDYHGSMDNYARAKAILFQAPSLKSMIINMDDPRFVQIQGCHPSAKVFGYGFHPHADVRIETMNWSLQGMCLECQTPWGSVKLKSSLIGDFNVLNILAVFSALMAQGFELSSVVDAIANLQAAPGRMQVVGRGPLIIVDYAHTPDALEKALTTLAAFKLSTKARKLWVIFGCGGNRDPLKRPMMGKIAASLADMVVVTSDNPRLEPPLEIIHQILAGIPSDFSAKLAIEDRKLAIITALQEAKPNDIILIAGKGHEEYQEIGHEKNYFSDQFVVKDYLHHTEF